MVGFALKVKMKNGQQIVNTLAPENTIRDLKQTLSNISSIPVNRLQVLSGYPPKTVDVSQDSLVLSKSGISAGDTLILEEKPESPPVTRPDERQTINYVPDELVDYPGILMKKVVPADNSCLFTSINFVLNGKVDDSGNVAPWMRKLIAETVLGDPITYSEAILGKSNEEYSTWIQDDKSWGGAIELSILSKYYGVEIAVVDTINAIINRFGEDQHFAHRVFLMFDGIHYDPLFIEPLDGSKIQTIFPSEDERILHQAKQLAVEAKSSRQFTDVNKFTLKCLECNIFLNGQVGAQQHAQSTGHMNFGEV